MPDQKDDSGLAFPSDYMIREFAESKRLTDEQKEKQILFVSGISVRDYFAAKAMPLYRPIGGEEVNFNFENPYYEDAARRCYAYADAMLKARKS